MEEHFALYTRDNGSIDKREETESEKNKNAKIAYLIEINHNILSLPYWHMNFRNINIATLFLINDVTMLASLIYVRDDQIYLTSLQSCNVFHYCI